MRRLRTAPALAALSLTLLLTAGCASSATHSDAPASTASASAPADDTARRPTSPDDPDFNAPRANSELERRVLDALATIQAGDRHLNVSSADGRVLRQLVETLDAQKVVEIGTSTGESAIWMALGLRGTGGKLITHEIDADLAERARANFELAGVDDLVTIVLGDAHETVLALEGPIDLLFLDADKSGYVDYLEKLLPKVRPGGLIVAHNMRRPTPDPRYLDAITNDPALETSFLLMDGAGLGVTLKKR